MGTAYISHPACLVHEMGEHHPESPARLRAIEDRLITLRLDGLLTRVEAPRATREQLERVHTRAYLDRLHAISPQHGHVRLDPDTALNHGSLEAALRAAGAVVEAVDRVMAGKDHNAFCAVRPPGHHAEADRAMGFCIFNNVAVGAAHAMTVHGLERVAIADFDVHHGNGTEHMFRGDPRVLFCSSFQHPFYPYTPLQPEDTGAGPGHIITVPLQTGTGSTDFRQALSDTWFPAIERFSPQLLLVSAGFDAHREDDMAELNLTDSDYAWVTKQLMQLAEKHCEGRIVSTLEGGYALDALARSVVAHLRVLMGLDHL